MKIMRSIILCMSLSLCPLIAQQPAQQTKPSLMQKLKKEWKKVAAYGYRGTSRLVRVKVGSTYEVQSLRCEDY